MFNVYYILMDVTVTQWHSLAMLARIKTPYDSLNLTRAFSQSEKALVRFKESGKKIEHYR